MKACGCKPGTYDNGWMEVRCPTCLEEEREVWRRLFSYTRSPEFRVFCAKIKKEIGDGSGHRM